MYNINVYERTQVYKYLETLKLLQLMAYVIFAIVWPANLDLYQCLVSNNVNMERDTWTMKKNNLSN